MKISGFAFCLLALVCAFAFDVSAGTVIDFTSVRAHRKCSSMLSKKEQTDAHGELLFFAASKPEFVAPEAFLEDMREAGYRAIYFFYADSNQPPLANNEQGKWASRPVLPLTRDLYILKTVRPVTSRDHRRVESGSWAMSELNRVFKPVSFTRVRISPMFSVLHQTIDFIRSIESRYNNEEYHPVNLSYAPILAEGALKYRLVDFVNSWDVRQWEVWNPSLARDKAPEMAHDQREEVAKEILKSLIFKLGAVGHSIHTDEFIRQLGQEMLSIYPPEVVDSLMDNLKRWS